MTDAPLLALRDLCVSVNGATRLLPGSHADPARHDDEDLSAAAAACAPATVAPRAVTASTRPPAATSPEASVRVPAWKTCAPVASAASSPVMAPPASGVSG